MQAYSYTTWQDDVNVYISILLVYKIWIVTNWIFRASYFILEDFSVVIMNENVLSGMLLPDSKEIMLCPSFSLCRLLNGIELPCLVHLFTARCRLNNRRFIALKICQFMFGPTQFWKSWTNPRWKWIGRSKENCHWLWERVKCFHVQFYLEIERLIQLRSKIVFQSDMVYYMAH